MQPQDISLDANQSEDSLLKSLDALTTLGQVEANRPQIANLHSPNIASLITKNSFTWTDQVPKKALGLLKLITASATFSKELSACCSDIIQSLKEYENNVEFQVSLTACLWNLSVHAPNREKIFAEARVDVLPYLANMLLFDDERRAVSAGTLRNLSQSKPHIDQFFGTSVLKNELVIVGKIRDQELLSNVIQTITTLSTEPKLNYSKLMQKTPSVEALCSALNNAENQKDVTALVDILLPLANSCSRDIINRSILMRLSCLPDSKVSELTTFLLNLIKNNPVETPVAKLDESKQVNVLKQLVTKPNSFAPPIPKSSPGLSSSASSTGFLPTQLGGSKKATPAIKWYTFDIRPKMETQEKKSQLERLLLELLTTEETYIHGLEMICQEIYFPLRKTGGTGYEKTFDEIHEIFMEHVTLYEEVRARVCSWVDGSTIGDIFASRMPLLKPVYCKYCSTYEILKQERLDILKLLDLPTQAMIAEFEENISKNHKINLTALLITPVQRLPRYELLLKNIWSELPNDQFLKVAIDETQNAINAIDKETGKAHSREEIRKIVGREGRFSCLLFDPPIYGSRNRDFLRYVSITGIHNIGKKLKVRQSNATEMIIFTDMIVASPFVSSKNNVNEFHIPLSLLWVDPNPSFKVPSFDSTKNHVSLIGPETSWIIEVTPGEWRGALKSLQSHPDFPAEDEAILKGDRYGAFKFNKGGKYEGEWRNGWFHGRGKFTKDDGFVFDGYWNEPTRTGYGHIHSWITMDKSLGGFRSKGNTIEIDHSTEKLWGHPQLTKEEWSQILLGSNSVNFKAGETIQTIGQKDAKLYFVDSGTVVFMSQNRKKIHVSEPGTILGWELFLDDPSITRVSVAYTNVSAFQISPQFLSTLFLRDVGIFMKFFHHVAKQLLSLFRCPELMDHSNFRCLFPSGIVKNLPFSADKKILDTLKKNAGIHGFDFNSLAIYDGNHVFYTVTPETTMADVPGHTLYLEVRGSGAKPDAAPADAKPNWLSRKSAKTTTGRPQGPVPSANRATLQPESSFRKLEPVAPPTADKPKEPFAAPTSPKSTANKEAGTANFPIPFLPGDGQNPTPARATVSPRQAGVAAVVKAESTPPLPRAAVPTRPTETPPPSNPPSRPETPRSGLPPGPSRPVSESPNDLLKKTELLRQSKTTPELKRSTMTSEIKAEFKKQTTLSDKEKNINERFDLDASEILINQSTCAKTGGKNRVFTQNGTLYLFAKYLCFEAQAISEMKLFFLYWAPNSEKIR